jgi:hypothetical protein
VAEEFSQKWEIYRIATHPLGGLHLIADMDNKYSIGQLYNMLEVLEVHDSLKKAAHDKAIAETKKP